MGQATEHLSARTGPGIGGLLNATFGNAAELIIALMALSKGLICVVKASITGSIIGILLFVLPEPAHMKNGKAGPADRSAISQTNPEPSQPQEAP